jgi:hypothetical protein
MPKVRLREPLIEIQGVLYDVVFKRSPQGKMIVTARPDMSNVEWSPAQKAQRERFRLAVAYAKAALADPERRPRYERRAKRQKKRPWDVAIAEYFEGQDSTSKK